MSLFLLFSIDRIKHIEDHTAEMQDKRRPQGKDFLSCTKVAEQPRADQCQTHGRVGCNLGARWRGRPRRTGILPPSLFQLFASIRIKGGGSGGDGWVPPIRSTEHRRAPNQGKDAAPPRIVRASRCWSRFFRDASNPWKEVSGFAGDRDTRGGLDLMCHKKIATKNMTHRPMPTIFPPKP